jgi:hypothetical protein
MKYLKWDFIGQEETLTVPISQPSSSSVTPNALPIPHKKSIINLGHLAPLQKAGSAPAIVTESKRKVGYFRKIRQKFTQNNTQTHNFTGKV